MEEVLVKTVGGSSSSTTNINYSFVQFWGGVFKFFFCAYSGRRVVNNSFVQFWGGVFINFFCVYSGRRVIKYFFCAYSRRRDINSLVQFWDGVYNYKVIKCIEVG